MSHNVLLVEPGYKNKYPPMGLMKISTYHKNRGDQVTFVKGLSADAKNRLWDRVYITTLFTFHFDLTVRTIRYYKECVTSLKKMYVGGILASLMPQELRRSTGVSNIFEGLLVSDKLIGFRKGINIDELILDYEILEQIQYKYPAGDSYFSYTTRGCPNKCKFCAVPRLEPEFKTTNHIKEQIELVDNLYGQKRKLLLLDNNVLFSDCLEQIIEDIKDCGFNTNQANYTYPNMFSIYWRRLKNNRNNEALLDRTLSWLIDFKSRIRKKGDQEAYQAIIGELKENLSYKTILRSKNALDKLITTYKDRSLKRRYVDFNQGLDARLITEDKMRILSKIPIRPFRIAFDNIKDEKLYIKAMKTAIKHGVREFSNYILYNYNDKPEDLWYRLQINMELKEELGVNIYSFPMKYVPIGHKNRDFIGAYWNRKYLRAIQSILLVKRGIVSSRKDFFHKAFGSNLDEYMELLMMPEDLIIYRFHYEGLGISQKWKDLYNSMSEEEKNRLLEIVNSPEVPRSTYNLHNSNILSDILKYYDIRYRHRNISRDSDMQMEIDYISN